MITHDSLIPALDLSDYTPSDDLARAATMPSRWYIDPAVLELEKPKIFWKTWQPVGRLDQVMRRGDYFTANVVGRTNCRHARLRRSTARVLQRLPTPCGARRRWHGESQKPPVQISRLDV